MPSKSREGLAGDGSSGSVDLDSLTRSERSEPWEGHLEGRGEVCTRCAGD